MNSFQFFATYMSDGHYLIKASLILCILYLPFYFIFSKEVSFITNRVYLLSTILLTLILPLVGFDVFPVIVTVSSTNETMKVGITNPSISYANIFRIGLTIMYIVGLIWMLGKMVLNLLNIYKIITSNDKAKHNNYTLVFVSHFPVSGFFKYIFLPSSDTDHLLIHHEIIHAEKLHSIDVLLAELLRSVLWFHPFAHMLQKAVMLNHEYECDAKMAEMYTYQKYGNLILQYAQCRTQNSFINHFNSFTKKRITMMLQQKNNPQNTFRYLLIVPVLLSVFIFFSFRAYYTPVKMTAPILSNNDTIPKKQGEIVDTIINLEMDDNNNIIKETRKVVRRSLAPTLDPDEIIRQNPELIMISDTFIDLNPDTYQEKMTVIHGKMVKGYRILIDNEYSKPNPDKNLIEKWRKEGARD